MKASGVTSLFPFHTLLKSDITINWNQNEITQKLILSGSLCWGLVITWGGTDPPQAVSRIKHFGHRAEIPKLVLERKLLQADPLVKHLLENMKACFSCTTSIHQQVQRTARSGPRAPSLVGCAIWTQAGIHTHISQVVTMLRAKWIKNLGRVLKPNQEAYKGHKISICQEKTHPQAMGMANDG